MFQEVIDCSGFGLNVVFMVVSGVGIWAFVGTGAGCFCWWKRSWKHIWVPSCGASDLQSWAPRRPQVQFCLSCNYLLPLVSNLFSPFSLNAHPLQHSTCLGCQIWADNLSNLCGGEEIGICSELTNSALFMSASESLCKDLWLPKLWAHHRADTWRSCWSLHPGLFEWYWYPPTA